jgi:hypothetical protein
MDYPGWVVKSSRACCVMFCSDQVGVADGSGVACCLNGLLYPTQHRTPYAARQPTSATDGAHVLCTDGAHVLCTDGAHVLCTDGAHVLCTDGAHVLCTQIMGVRYIGDVIHTASCFHCMLLHNSGKQPAWFVWGWGLLHGVCFAMNCTWSLSCPFSPRDITPHAQ